MIWNKLQNDWSAISETPLELCMNQGKMGEESLTFSAIQTFLHWNFFPDSISLIDIEVVT